MVLPKGNTLIEKVNLDFNDIRTHLENLEEEDFTGYVKFDLGKTDGVIFYKSGKQLDKAVEVEDGKVRLYRPDHIMYRLKGKDIPVSTYVLSPALLNIFSSLVALEPIYIDYSIKKKEIKSLMQAIFKEKYTGIVEINSEEGTNYLALDKGRVVFDNYIDGYGSIITGMEKYNAFMDNITASGAKINAFAQRSKELQKKLKEAEEELSKIKQLVVKKDAGLLSGGDQVKIDHYIMNEWGAPKGGSVKVQIELQNGKSFHIKCTGSGKLGGYILTNKGVMKKYQLQENEAVFVKPVLDEEGQES
ncbi:MAG: hypothetical protein M1269_01620 [Chloroflexi bacterium]|nr:hypothetical protein [Chloroflexota bacterium]